MKHILWSFKGVKSFKKILRQVYTRVHGYEYDGIISNLYLTDLILQISWNECTLRIVFVLSMIITYASLL